MILIILAPVLKHIVEKINLWATRRKYIQQNQEYLNQLVAMDTAYHPEKTDVEMAQKCKEYLVEMFPEGITERTRNMSQEELMELFKKLTEDAQLLMDVHVGNVEFYASDNPLICNNCGFYSHEKDSLFINAAFILSGEPAMVEEQVYTVFHEMKHARQWAAIEGKLHGTKDYGYSDEQIRIWAENLERYVPSFVDDELYRKQPVEADAFGFETILKGERRFETI